jgi:NAD(P)H-dependent FMN reductase
MDITNSANSADSTNSAPLKLAVIVASNREGRFGPVVADWLLGRTAERDDFTVDVVDLADIDLPTSLSHPEYNHSFPASLKSLIDWHFTEWQAKPVGFVSYGGMAGGVRAVEQLRQVYAEVHAVTVRDTVSFHNAWGLFEEGGRHKDPTGPDAAAKTMLDQLAWWAHALRDAKSSRPYAA